MAAKQIRSLVKSWALEGESGFSSGSLLSCTGSGISNLLFFPPWISRCALISAAPINESKAEVFLSGLAEGDGIRQQLTLQELLLSSS